jgi:hypothetical protein
MVKCRLNDGGVLRGIVNQSLLRLAPIFPRRTPAGASIRARATAAMPSAIVATFGLGPIVDGAAAHACTSKNHF